VRRQLLPVLAPDRGSLGTEGPKLRRVQEVKQPLAASTAEKAGLWSQHTIGESTGKLRDQRGPRRSAATARSKRPQKQAHPLVSGRFRPLGSLCRGHDVADVAGDAACLKPATGGSVLDQDQGGRVNSRAPLSRRKRAAMKTSPGTSYSPTTPLGTPSARRWQARAAIRSSRVCVRDELVKASYVAIAPPVAVFILGMSLLWVVRGFRSEAS
jgi:hypothetical protein